MNTTVLAVALVVTAVLAITPALRSSRAWKATVTPLSSIMGSGFLVSAPLVAAVTGVWAPLAMVGLLVVAYGLGAMIRFNIRYAEPIVEGRQGEHHAHRGHCDSAKSTWAVGEERVARTLERASHLVLAGAYVVSVSYYLQLLAAFVLDRLGMQDPMLARTGTTVVLGAIATAGSLWGLSALEKLETAVVSLNLGTIAALLVGLLVHDVGLALDGSLALPDLPVEGTPTHAVRVMMGLLIVVQGFETSRFLGAEHPPEERVATMRIAQLASAAIYVLFVTLMLPLLHGGLSADVTAIVGLVGPVATVLPTLIVVAAIGSQLNAAVADDAGCVGLMETIVGDRLSPRWVYLVVGGLAIGVTWLTDVLSVISVASRAFALFYALQCLVTVATALEREDAEHRRVFMVAGGVLALIAASVTVLGIPASA